jgi:hypothetical protein
MDIAELLANCRSKRSLTQNVAVDEVNLPGGDRSNSRASGLRRRMKYNINDADNLQNQLEAIAGLPRYY